MGGIKANLVKFAGLGLCCNAAPAHASETITYTYDALGRKIPGTQKFRGHEIPGTPKFRGHNTN